MSPGVSRPERPIGFEAALALGSLGTAVANNGQGKGEPNNCHGQIVSLNAKERGIKETADARGLSVQELQEAIRDHCAPEEE